MFVHGKPLQPCLMFEGEAGAYPRMGQMKCASPGEAPRLTYQHWTILERSIRDEHCSLFQTFVNYGRKKFYNIGPLGANAGVNAIRHFS